MENLGTATDTCLVAATTAKDFLADANYARSCKSIELLASGTLEYVTPAGATRTLTGMTAGIKPIQARSITANTTMAIVAYFN